MSNRLSNEQKIKQRPMRAYPHQQWMLTNWGQDIGIFRTRKEANDYVVSMKSDMQYYEIRRVLVRVEQTA